jgi:YkoY family integral membrane protein
VLEFPSIIAFWDTPIPPGFFYESLMIILELILIEGLLSVDNALGIAAMASNLPKHQQKPALRWGLLGAYLFRGIALATVAWLMHNPWLKWFGAIYLVYLATNHLGQPLAKSGASEEHHEEHKKLAAHGFLRTIIAIELMDLSLSLDNVVAAVGLIDGAKHIPEEYHIYVVCTGVFIGIFALRILAGWCISILEKFPVLSDTAFVLIGFVGVQLLVSMAQDSLNYPDLIPNGLHVAFKFVVIASIVALSIGYTKSSKLHSWLAPLTHACRVVSYRFAQAIHWIFSPLVALFHRLSPSKSHD